MTRPNGNPNMGPGDLPPKLTLSTFTAARVKEIQAMRKHLNSNWGTKMAFQKLPKHMRRRAMSHVVKRLPRRLREIHTNQMKKSGLPPKSKRPSRRYRRRPLNLQSEYVRRQRRIHWLNTHIWHAKRFFMTEKWGFKLPKQPCDKSFRACYRATTQHCLLQDISYCRCLEVSGEYEEIVTTLSRVTDRSCGLTFGAACFKSGKKFGEVIIFECRNERRPIGKVQFLWTQKDKNLWLFVHPAFYKQILTLLINLFNLRQSTDDSHKLIPTYVGSKATFLRELHHELDYFRLTGPLSTAILKHALKPANLDESSSFLTEHPLDVLKEQNQIYEDLMDSSYLPPNMVLSVIVEDPRLHMPKKRMKAVLEKSFDNDQFDVLQRNLSISPLVTDSVRKYVKEKKVSNAEVCRKRADCLVPGSEISLEHNFGVPLILLWRPENKTTANNGYGHGWDIIVPSSWSQSFFISFTMWGARVGGLRETDTVTFEKSQLDILYPDTEAGEKEEEHISNLYRDTFFRLPPNKRTNYNKFGIVSPFNLNWKMLISDWTGTKCNSFFVLRDKNKLKRIQELLVSQTETLQPSLPSNCLIPVETVLKSKGVCSRFSLICLNSKGSLLEPKRKDLLAQKRKLLRQEHKTLLERLKKRRKRSRKLGHTTNPTDASLLLNYRDKMRKLWLPEPTTIKDSCLNPVIGFIKHGGFSYTLGKCKGLGYITAAALNTLMRSPKRNEVLIRNPNSRHYKLSQLQVLVE